MVLSIGSTGPLVKNLQANFNLLPTRLPLLKLDGIFGQRTHGRVREFQGLSTLKVDGIVGALTIAALDLAIALLKGAVPPAPPPIIVTQSNPTSLTATHSSSVPIVAPPVTLSHDASFRFVELPAVARIREFLFKIEKANHTFWMGVCVPDGTTDFTRAQIFCHPTVVQAHHIIADDKDYLEFKGGWSQITTPSGSIQRYVALQGTQLAAAGKKYPMLVPFTTMKALALTSENMLASQPVATIAAVMQAIKTAVTGTAATTPPTLTALGITSFSSGITSLGLYRNHLAGSGLIKEVLDLDSPVIIGTGATSPKGANARCFSSRPPNHPLPGYIVMRKAHFANVTAYGQLTEGPPFDSRQHGRIGFMTYHGAMVTSALK